MSLSLCRSLLVTLLGFSASATMTEKTCDDDSTAEKTCSSDDNSMLQTLKDRLGIPTLEECLSCPHDLVTGRNYGCRGDIHEETCNELVPFTTQVLASGKCAAQTTQAICQRTAELQGLRFGGAVGWTKGIAPGCVISVTAHPIRRYASGSDVTSVYYNTYASSTYSCAPPSFPCFCAGEGNELATETTDPDDSKGAGSSEDDDYYYDYYGDYGSDGAADSSTGKGGRTPEERAAKKSERAAKRAAMTPADRAAKKAERAAKRKANKDARKKAFAGNKAEAGKKRETSKAAKEEAFAKKQASKDARNKKGDSRLLQTRDQKTSIAQNSVSNMTGTCLVQMCSDHDCNNPISGADCKIGGSHNTWTNSWKGGPRQKDPVSFKVTGGCEFVEIKDEDADEFGYGDNVKMDNPANGCHQLPNDLANDVTGILIIGR